MSTRVFVCYDCNPEEPCVLVVPEAEYAHDKEPVCPFDPTAKKWIEVWYPTSRDNE